MTAKTYLQKIRSERLEVVQLQETVDELLAQNLGAGVTIEEFINYQKTYYQGSPYYNDEIAKLEATDAEIEASDVKQPHLCDKCGECAKG